MPQTLSTPMPHEERMKRQAAGEKRYERIGGTDEDPHMGLLQVGNDYWSNPYEAVHWGQEPDSRIVELRLYESYKIKGLQIGQMITTTREDDGVPAGTRGVIVELRPPSEEFFFHVWFEDYWAPRACRARCLE